MFVTHPICDAARNLAAVWGRNVSYPCQILYLPQNPNSPNSVIYLRGEYDRMKRSVEEISRQPITDEALRDSIAVFNENRALIRELYEIKKNTPWLVSADEAYVLVALAGMIPREEHNELLRSLLPQIRARAARTQDKVRVVFEGGFCEQPPLDLIRAIYAALWQPQRHFTLHDILELVAQRPELLTINAAHLGVSWYRNHPGELKTIRP